MDDSSFVDKAERLGGLKQIKLPEFGGQFIPHSRGEFAEIGVRCVLHREIREIPNGVKVIESDNETVPARHHRERLFAQLVAGHCLVVALFDKDFERNLARGGHRVAGVIDDAARTPADDREDLVPVVEYFARLTVRHRLNKPEIESFHRYESSPHVAGQPDPRPDSHLAHPRG